MAESKTGILFVGALPPPLHGQSNVNEQILRLLEPQCDLIKVDLSPGRLRRSMTYHLTRIGRVFRASLIVLRTQPRYWLYLSLDSGLGLLYNVLIVAIARSVGRKILLHHHSYSYIVRPTLLMSLLLRVAGKNAHHIFLCNRMQDQFCQEYAFNAKSLIISDALFDPPAEAGNERLEARRPLRVGMLGNLTAEKGLHDFLQLLRVTKQRGLPIVGILAGPAVSESDASAIEGARQDLGSYLDYRGPQFGAARDKFYADIDVFLFPTRYAVESYGQVVVEALAKGLPTLAYGRGCISSYLAPPAGYAIPQCEDFVSVVFVHLERWLAAPEDYKAASAGAVKLSRALYQEAENDFAAMLSLLTRARP